MSTKTTSTPIVFLSDAGERGEGEDVTDRPHAHFEVELLLEEEDEEDEDDVDDTHGHGHVGAAAAPPLGRPPLREEGENHFHLGLLPPDTVEIFLVAPSTGDPAGVPSSSWSCALLDALLDAEASAG